MHHRIIARALVAVFLAMTLVGSGCVSEPTQEERDRAAALEPPPAPREFRGVWVATVGNIDWPSKPGLSTQEQKDEAIAILDKCAELNLNAVVFQVRPACDAFYASKIEPWSYFLTGQQGKAPDPYYDPLKFWVVETHKRGLELHAWFNPYRAKAPGDKSPLAPNSFAKKHPNDVKECGEYLWMDPGSKVAQDQTYKVFMDVLHRYDVDGLHIDDYFYPYPEYLKALPGQQFPDDETWNAYLKSGGKLSRDDWRRENVNKLVYRIYKGTRNDSDDAKFGISPFGLGHDRPEGVKGFDPYKELYADAEKWWMAGWCDYLTPQLYWKISSPGQPYGALLAFWAMENQLHRNLWPGNYTGRVREAAPPPVTQPSTTQAATMTAQDLEKWRKEQEAARQQRIWTPQEIVDQIEVTRTTAGATGNVHFSMKVFMPHEPGESRRRKRRNSDAPTTQPTTAPSTSSMTEASTEPTTQPAPGLIPSRMAEVLEDGPYKDQALVPVSPWLDNKAPAKPALDFKRNGSTIKARFRPKWELFGGEKPWLWAVYVRHGDVWDFHVYPGQLRELELNSDENMPGAITAIAVAQVDRCGNESKRNVQEVK